MTQEKKVEPAPLVPPFVCYVASAIPMVFDDSLSYYECLAALTKYLQDVVNVINNNGEVTEEYIQLTKDMKEYMDNYFDNLDVQEEINNKLDAMVEAGTLQEIIGEYLNATAVWGFDTVSDMKAGTNLINGSYARTLGFHDKNDGGGATYKIRNITNDDVVDEMTIIEIGDGTNELIAELILPAVITPEIFGAYGDGVHDDTVALRKAFTTDSRIVANKNYLISEKIRIGDFDNLNIDAKKSTITFNGVDDFAFLIQHLNGGNIDFGKIISNTGCIEMVSQNGTSDRVQYLTLTFNHLRGTTYNIYGNVSDSGWLNEITVKGGYMTRGEYGIYLTNSSPQLVGGIGAWKFYNIGFEGTDHNITLISASGSRQRGHYFENCRYAENLTSMLLETTGTIDRLIFIGWGGIDETRLNIELSKFKYSEIHAPIYETGTSNIKASGIYYSDGTYKYLYDYSTWSLPTKSSGVTGTIRFAREGNCCIIRLASVVTDSASGNLIDSLPFIPKELTSNFVGTSNGDAIMRVYANTSGNLKFETISGNIGKSFNGELVYWTDTYLQ